MSVLSKMIKERAEWANQNRVIAARQHQTRIIADYLMTVVFCILPAILFVFRDKIILMIKTLLH